MNNNFWLFKGILTLSLLFPLAGSTATIDKLRDKSLRSSQVLNEVVRISDNSIPLSLLEKSVCIATFPDVIRGGFVFGARYGSGVVSCRTPGGWSQPSYLKIAGGSWGLQIGLASVDTVLVFVNKNALDRLSVNNFTLGGDVSVAAGPIGRDIQVGTDYQLTSEVYSYSRSRGLFGGLILEGASIMVDTEANTKMYSVEQTASEILATDGRHTPKSINSYVNTLNRIAP
jgi:lipid-binding SYLF domain-containing protein